MAIDPAMLGGRPCVRDRRATVGMVVGQIGAGRDIGERLSSSICLAADEADDGPLVGEDTKDAGAALDVVVEAREGSVA